MRKLYIKMFVMYKYFNVFLINNFLLEMIITMKELDIISSARSSALARIVINQYGGIQEFCQKTGEDYAAIHRYINKVIKMGDKAARRLETVLNVAKGYLDQHVAKDEVTYIPIISTSLKKGQALSGLIKESKESSMLPSSAIGSFGWNPETLVVIRLADDSMEPYLHEGTNVLIDYSQKSIQLNKVYAVRLFNDICVRRISKSQTTGNIILIPDSSDKNKNYEKIEIQHNNFEIIGKAVFLMGVLN